MTRHWGRLLAAVALTWATTGAAAPAAPAPDGANGFDFELGEWRVHHVVQPLDPKAPAQAFEGTASVRPLLGGLGNVEDNVFFRPAGVTRGVALRAYDPKTQLWAIWWVDGRDPHAALDPPMKGRFEGGVGTFYSDGPVNGRPARTRFIWSHITRTSAHWEQAYSLDAGKTWETNWIMEFQRIS